MYTISIQAHTNQINLLNEYIKALEKQIEGSRIENQKLQKHFEDTSQLIASMSWQINRAKNQSGQLKKQNFMLNQRLRQFMSMEKQQSELRERLRVSSQQKVRVSDQLKRVIEILKNQEGRIKEKDSQLGQKSQAYRQKLQEIQRLQTLIQTQKQQFFSEKIKMQASYRQAQTIIAVKDSLIQNLEKQMQQTTKQFQGKSIAKDQSIQALVMKLSAHQKQSQSLKKQMVSKVGQLSTLQLKMKQQGKEYKQKGKEYEDRWVRSEGQRRRFQGEISTLKKQLQEIIALKSSSQGNLSQSSKALSQAFKKNQDLSKRISLLEMELQQKTSSARQLSDHLSKLHSQLQNITICFHSLTQEKTTQLNTKTANQGILACLRNSIEDANQQISLKKSALQKLEGEVKGLIEALNGKNKSIGSKDETLRYKEKLIEGLREELRQLQCVLVSFSKQKDGFDQLLRFQQQKSKLIGSKLESMTTSWSERLSDRERIQLQINKSQIIITGIQHRIEALSDQLSITHSNIQATTKAHTALKKKADKDKEELWNRLSESFDLNERKEIRIKQLSTELREVEQDLKNMLTSTNLSARQQIDQEKAKFQRKILEMSLQNKTAFQKKQEQLNKLKEGWKSKEGQMSKMKIKLQSQIFELKQQIKRIGLQSALSSQTTRHQQQFRSSLKLVTQELQIYIKQQKANIAQLLDNLEAKNRQVQALQDSNQIIRKQILQLMKNQQDLKKQILEVKMKASSYSSTYNRNSSRGIKIADTQKPYKSTYNQIVKSNKSSGVHERKGSKEVKRTNFKENEGEYEIGVLGLPKSKVKDMNESDVQEEAVFYNILDQQIENTRR